MMVDKSPELGTFPQLHSSDALVGAAALANGAGCAATSGCSAAEAGESVSTVDDKTRRKPFQASTANSFFIFEVPQIISPL